jgi:hypothetical protein
MDEEESAEDMFSKAIAKLQHAYRKYVKDIDIGILEAMQDGEVFDRESLDTRVRETVDGNAWVIYTYKAQAVVICSDHGSYGMEEGCVSQPSFKDGIPWSDLAYHAMEQDVWDCIRRYQDEYGFDIDADDLGIEEDEDEEPESDPSP